MKYYSEEEVIKLLMKEENYLEHSAQDVVRLMTPAILPTLESTSSDRERIRMDLWREFASISINKADEALAAFDKQFPK